MHSRNDKLLIGIEIPFLYYQNQVNMTGKHQVADIESLRTTDSNGSIFLLRSQRGKFGQLQTVEIIFEWPL
jgi:hypothetical protein